MFVRTWGKGWGGVGGAKWGFCTIASQWGPPPPPPAPSLSSCKHAERKGGHFYMRHQQSIPHPSCLHAGEGLGKARQALPFPHPFHICANVQGEMAKSYVFLCTLVRAWKSIGGSQGVLHCFVTEQSNTALPHLDWSSGSFLSILSLSLLANTPPPTLISVPRGNCTFDPISEASPRTIIKAVQYTLCKERKKDSSYYRGWHFGLPFKDVSCTLDQNTTQQTKSW